MAGKVSAAAVVGGLAARSLGVVTRSQLLSAGLTRHQIDGRIANGTLVATHRGVYRAGGAPETPDAAYLAAVLACGSAAALGGMAAAWRYGTARGRPPPPEVIAPTERRVSGVICRRGHWPHTEFRGIETLTVPASLVDVAGRLSIEDLARACHEAGVRYATTPRAVAAVLRTHANARGAANLRLVMTGDERVTLSRLESAFLSVLRAEHLPLPSTNRLVGGKRVDCRWPEHRLTVELDSFAFHNSRHSWQDGHTRERQAYARGDAFRRYTWADVLEDPAQMLAELTRLLGPVRAGRQELLGLG